jgi:hypothetical protein
MVNGLIKVLDEDVSNSRFADTWVTEKNRNKYGEKIGEKVCVREK